METEENAVFVAEHTKVGLLYTFCNIFSYKYVQNVAAKWLTLL